MTAQKLIRLRLDVLLLLDKDQVKALKNHAKDTGHGFDGLTAPTKLIKRLLEAKVREAVYSITRNSS
jgi:hypothetical protein